MTAIRIEGLDDVRTFLAGLAGDIPKVNEKSQNALAIEVWKAWKADAKDSFEGGATPFTLGSLNYKKYGASQIGLATVSEEGAMVAVVDRHRGQMLAQSSGDQQSYLGVMAVGGKPGGPKASVRRFRSMGIIPNDYTWAPAAGAPKDRYGNLKGSDISDMFTSLGLGFVTTENQKYRYIYGEEQRPVGVARKVRKTWKPYLWFIPEPTYEGGVVDWDFAAQQVVNTEAARIIGYYLDKALAGRL